MAAVNWDKVSSIIVLFIGIISLAYVCCDDKFENSTRPAIFGDEDDVNRTAIFDQERFNKTIEILEKGARIVSTIATVIEIIKLVVLVIIVVGVSIAIAVAIYLYVKKRRAASAGVV